MIGLLSIFIGATSLNGQSIDDLLKTAATNNLEIKTFEIEYRTALERIPQVGVLPDPEIGVGVFPLPVETRLGGQFARLSAMQMFPWKGTLDGQKDLEAAKAKALYERMAATSLNLNFQIKQAWYNLYQLEQSQTIIQRNLTLLTTLERLALAKVESGKGTAADVLRVQLKTEEMQQELIILETAKITPTVMINQLLNRPLNTSITVVDSLDFSVIPFNKDTLSQYIEANHPMLRMYELQQDISKKAIALNGLARKPSFGVGLDYIAVDKRSDANPSHNGRDILQLKATIKIPLYKEKYAAKEREERLKMEALDFRKADNLSMFLAEIEKAYAKYQTAQLRVELYEKQRTITQAAIRILEARYSAQGNGFDELLRLEKELIDYDLKTLKAIVQSHLAKSEIERFINF